mgnify:CR=1 FL=1
MSVQPGRVVTMVREERAGYQHRDVREIRRPCFQSLSQIEDDDVTGRHNDRMVGCNASETTLHIELDQKVIEAAGCDQSSVSIKGQCGGLEPSDHDGAKMPRRKVEAILPLIAQASQREHILH